MTGLDAEKDSIMSIACIITDCDLNIVEDEGFDAVIHHEKDELDRMNQWCKRTHGDSGLISQCISSTTSAEQAAQSLLDYVRSYVKEPRAALLAGNSVHADKAFLSRQPYSPVIQHLHHRILDVSAIKEAARRWATETILKKTPQKKGLHVARADIMESIAEARFYRSSFFRTES